MKIFEEGLKSLLDKYIYRSAETTDDQKVSKTVIFVGQISNEDLLGSFYHLAGFEVEINEEIRNF